MAPLATGVDAACAPTVRRSPSNVAIDAIDLQATNVQVPPLPESSLVEPTEQKPSTKEAEKVRSECVRNLRRERDYWRIVAMELKQQGLPNNALGQNSQKSSRPGSERSTSQSHQEG